MRCFGSPAGLSIALAVGAVVVTHAASLMRLLRGGVVVVVVVIQRHMGQSPFRPARPHSPRTVGADDAPRTSSLSPGPVVRRGRRSSMRESAKAWASVNTRRWGAGWCSASAMAIQNSEGPQS